jgi:shikimate dehydrogenase
VSARRVFLLGHPLGHSRSPAFQNAAFRAAGIDAVYALADIPPEEIPATVAGLRADDVYGANVTVPYKQAVIPYLDALDDDARALGAVNTIVNRGGTLFGMNTDVPGFAADLRAHGVSVAGETVVVLGAGGAARGVVAALVGLEAGRIVVANRTLARAEAITASYPGHPIATTALDAPTLPDALGSAALLVNATSSGLHGDEAPIPLTFLAALPSGAAVYDLIYRPTTLLRAATARGLRAIDGLGMLIYQGAFSWEAWTGQPAPLDAMWAALGTPRRADSPPTER